MTTRVCHSGSLTASIKLGPDRVNKRTSLGKLLGGFLGGRLAGHSVGESWTLGIGLNGRGIMELVIASIALKTASSIRNCSRSWSSWEH
jgi:hypothetical protein